MTTASNQQEPSMEEILSSIRRIIADEQDGSEGDSNEAASEPTPAPSGEPELPVAAVSLDEEPVVDQVEDEAEDDVFDLTDIVSTPDEEPPKAEEELVADSEDPVGSLFDDEPAIDEPVFDEPASEASVHSEFDNEEFEHAGEPEDHSDSAMEPVPDASQEEPSEDIFATSAEEPLTEEPEQDWADEVEMAPIETDPEPVVEDEQPELSHDEIEPQLEAQAVAQQVDETIISDAAAAASAGSLAKLAKVAAGDRSNDVEGGGKSVEQFMAEMVKPMLKDWLDENLNTIVERVVEQEVKKLVRRAELM